METTTSVAVSATPALRTGTPEPADSQQPHAPHTRLYGRRLLAARIAWAATATVIVGLYILLLPACLTLLQTVCGGAHCALVQPTRESASTLRILHISVDTYATLMMSLIILSSLVCFTVGGVIVWRKSDDWLALLVALSAFSMGTQIVPYLVETGQSPWRLLALIATGLEFEVMYLLSAFFPNGRLAPRWALWLVVGWGAVSIALVVSYLVTGQLQFTPYAFLWLIACCAGGAAQFYRYRSVSTPRERAQTRWVVFGLTVGVLVVFAIDAPTFLFAGARQPGSFYLLVSTPIYALVVAFISICVGIAILQDRLFDIDVIIRRTLIYSIVTGMLAAIYAVISFVLQAGFVAVTGQGTPLAVVGSTLAIAGLFQPVRRRVQDAVDRRFYRRKYDAARTLAEFGSSLHSEVNLAQLGEHVLHVVDETMRPEHLSLWLTQPYTSGSSELAQTRQAIRRRSDAHD